MLRTLGTFCDDYPKTKNGIYSMILYGPEHPIALIWYYKVVIKSDLHRPCDGRSEKKKVCSCFWVFSIILSSRKEFRAEVMKCFWMTDLNIQSSSLFLSKIYFAVYKLSFLIYFLKSQNLDLRSFAAQSNCGDCIENLDCRAKLDLQDCSQVVL